MNEQKIKNDGLSSDTALFLSNEIKFLQHEIQKFRDQTDSSKEIIEVCKKYRTFVDSLMPPNSERVAISRLRTVRKAKLEAIKLLQKASRPRKSLGATGKHIRAQKGLKNVQ